MILATIMHFSMSLYDLAIFIAFSHVLYDTDSNFLLVRSPQTPVLRTPNFAYFINIVCGGCEPRPFSRTRRKKLCGWVKVKYRIVKIFR